MSRDSRGRARPRRRHPGPTTAPPAQPVDPPTPREEVTPREPWAPHLRDTGNGADLRLQRVNLLPALLNLLDATSSLDQLAKMPRRCIAVPVADTLKRADAEGRVDHTEPRDGLWRAQTPQMFRYGLLRQALETMGTATPTDEAQAIVA